jgi:predicted TIM-barrel fold metal-dependent hydrolase
VAALPEIKDFIRRFGTDRLLFGSDYPFGSPAAELDKILSLNLPEAQTRAILGDNFRRLCRLA